ncbi:DinB family protein, partial [Candidatus Fermentibacterales bacterium]|nr:DinB family protein [Candidatus Fermentibacterales bacterium]
MTWKDFIASEAASAYDTTQGLLGLVDPDALAWKPASGTNWMTTGQLLRHISDACGFCFRGFVTGDWGTPDGADLDALPSAEQLPSVSSLDEARRLLAEDRELAFRMLGSVSEQDLAQRITTAP